MRLARHAATGERVAVKIVPREVRRKLGDHSTGTSESGTPLTDEKVLREIAILKKCQHPNVVQLKEVIDDPQSRKIFMVLEYMDRGEIHWKDAAGRPTLTVEEARRTFRDVVLGLEFLHYQGIVHRDIKPANLLWDEAYNVKISDFGVSHLTVPTEDDEAELAKTAGSPAFFAPELCLCGRGKSNWPITKAIDVWALGVTLFCLLFGHTPFTAETEYALFSVIPYTDYALPATMGADCVPIGPRAPRWGAEAEADGAARAPLPQTREAQLVRDLLDRLLEKNPSKRITLDEVRHHPWIVSNLDDAASWLKQTDPAQAPSVEVSNEEVQGALTGLPRLRQQFRRLQHRLTESLSGLSSRRDVAGDESGSATPTSASSSVHSFAQASSRWLRGNASLMRTSTLPARPKLPRRAQSETQSTPRAASASTSLWQAYPDDAAVGSLPSAVTVVPAFEGLRIDDHDMHHDLSDDDLDEDVVSHSSSSRRTELSEPGAPDVHNTP